MLPPRNPDLRLKARGADTRPEGRFERHTRIREDDGWDIPEDQALLRTEVTTEQPRSIITRNSSPDIGFDRSINPYRGCEHGCIYCYARPSHAWLGLSPGLDFETKITAKPQAAALLARELARPGYRPAPIALGTNTDPYQPVEARLAIMPGLLRVLRDWNHPATLITRGRTVLRDLDLWAEMAARDQAMIGVSITTLDADLARALEPRAPAPAIRLRMIRELSRAGIPVRVMVAPVIPVLTEPEIEAILTAAREAGASTASMIALRLPHEVAPLFRDWLERHRPGMAAHVMNRVQAMRGGRDNDPRFGHRFKGEGVEADLARQRFRLARRRLGYREGSPALDCSRFGPPPRAGDQLSLF
ncbi:PA0069 family radical SAM protein [Paracoccus liaowanqingii]|uniref:PA0069 family radical SAM protein n=1 Tax=Paracoccus liaowanqingii TaxID=2560053 RepID=A0A4P7HQQ5_9RHOB|nr:PA0069 family radical SAM protein [Paracoccus liaowanqingii]QBX35651.1 PA0069 family radical SAM protein [Paracoccus liaowanqingii]